MANRFVAAAHRMNGTAVPHGFAQRCTTSANRRDFVFTGLEACATLRRQAKIQVN
jgi:hypothetical protein